MRDERFGLGEKGGVGNTREASQDLRPKTYRFPQRETSSLREPGSCSAREMLVGQVEVTSYF